MAEYDERARFVVKRFSGKGKFIIIAAAVLFVLRVPIMQKVIHMDVKIQKSETRAEASSSDLQDIKSLIALNYHIIADKANWVYQNVGIAFKDRIIDPNVQEAELPYHRR
jgi:hypothetical protein